MTLTVRRILRESPLLALILLVWHVAALVGTADPAVASAVRTAGLVMAGLFAVVRGVALADVAAPLGSDPSPGPVLELNGRALLAAAPWFLGAAVVQVLATVWRSLTRVGLFTSPADGLVALLANTGLLVVVLFAVAVGTATVRSTADVRDPSAR